jgi:mono/diheme cytochrome c family protein
MCVPCHGATLVGDGPVAALFMPPPDLLAEATRNRTDGFIFSYIRHGGVVMPRYGQSVSAKEAWDLVNYLRHEQRTNPR